MVNNNNFYLVQFFNNTALVFNVSSLVLYLKNHLKPTSFHNMVLHFILLNCRFYVENFYTFCFSVFINNESLMQHIKCTHYYVRLWFLRCEKYSNLLAYSIIILVDEQHNRTIIECTNDTPCKFAYHLLNLHENLAFLILWLFCITLLLVMLGIDIADNPKDYSFYLNKKSYLKWPGMKNIIYVFLMAILLLCILPFLAVVDWESLFKFKNLFTVYADATKKLTTTNEMVTASSKSMNVYKYVVKASNKYAPPVANDDTSENTSGSRWFWWIFGFAGSIVTLFGIWWGFSVIDSTSIDSTSIDSTSIASNKDQNSLFTSPNGVQFTNQAEFQAYMVELEDDYLEYDLRLYDVYSRQAAGCTDPFLLDEIDYWEKLGKNGYHTFLQKQRQDFAALQMAKANVPVEVKVRELDATEKHDYLQKSIHQLEVKAQTVLPGLFSDEYKMPFPKGELALAHGPAKDHYLEYLLKIRNWDVEKVIPEYKALKPNEFLIVYYHQLSYLPNLNENEYNLYEITRDIPLQKGKYSLYRCIAVVKK
jgi:hypothetical protein